MSFKYSCCGSIPNSYLSSNFKQMRVSARPPPRSIQLVSILHLSTSRSHANYISLFFISMDSEVVAENLLKQTLLFRRSNSASLISCVPTSSISDIACFNWHYRIGLRLHFPSLLSCNLLQTHFFQGFISIFIPTTTRRVLFAVWSDSVTPTLQCTLENVAPLRHFQYTLHTVLKNALHFHAILAAGHLQRSLVLTLQALPIQKFCVQQPPVPQCIPVPHFPIFYPSSSLQTSALNSNMIAFLHLSLSTSGIHNPGVEPFFCNGFTSHNAQVEDISSFATFSFNSCYKRYTP